MLFARWHLNTVRQTCEARHFIGVIFTIKPVDLHPLSLEDLLNVPGRPRSGANYYRGHLFIRVLSHTLDTDEDEGPDPLEQIVRSSSPEPFEAKEKAEVLPKCSTDDTPRPFGFTSKLSSKLSRSVTIDPEWDDVEDMGMTGIPTFVNYGSRYADYVRLYPPFLLLRVTHPPF